MQPETRIIVEFAALFVAFILVQYALFWLLFWRKRAPKVRIPKCYTPRVDDDTTLTRAEIEQGIARLMRCLGHGDDERCEVCGDDDVKGKP